MIVNAHERTEKKEKTPSEDELVANNKLIYSWPLTQHDVKIQTMAGALQQFCKVGKRL